MTERRSGSPRFAEMSSPKRTFEISDDAMENLDFNQLLKHRGRVQNSMVHLPPPKTTLAAVLMLLVGSIFLSLGIVTFTTNLMGGKTEDRDRGLAMLILGSLMFIPGSYASCVLYGAYRGWPNYEYNQIPSYDED